MNRNLEKATSMASIFAHARDNLKGASKLLNALRK